MHEEKSNKSIWLVIGILILLPTAVISILVATGTFSRPSFDELGGMRLTYRMDWEGAFEQGLINENQLEGREQLLAETIEILRERLDPDARHGVQFAPRGDDRFVIEAPANDYWGVGSSTTKAIRWLVGNGTELKLYIAAEPGDFPLGREMADELALAEEWREANPVASWSEYNDQLAADYGKLRDLRVLPRRYVDGTPRANTGKPTLVWNQKKKWTFTGADLESVNATTDALGYPAVALHLAEDRAAAFAEFTTENIDRGLAVVISDVIVTLATIRTTLGTDFIIEGQFTPEEVDVMVRGLRADWLVVTPEFVTEERVEPRQTGSGD